jgi:hypothetical protein
MRPPFDPTIIVFIVGALVCLYWLRALRLAREGARLFLRNLLKAFLVFCFSMAALGATRLRTHLGPSQEQRAAGFVALISSVKPGVGSGPDTYQNRQNEQSLVPVETRVDVEPFRERALAGNTMLWSGQNRVSACPSDVYAVGDGARRSAPLFNWSRISVTSDQNSLRLSISLKILDVSSKPSLASLDWRSSPATLGLE